MPSKKRPRSDHSTKNSGGTAHGDAVSSERNPKLRSTIAHLNIGAFIASPPDGPIVDANPALVRLSGYGSAEELRAGRRGKLWADRQDRQRFLDALARDGTVSNFETLLARKDGSACPVTVSAVVTRDTADGSERAIGTVEDISQRVQAEARTRTLLTMLDEAPGGVVIHGADGEIHYANRCASAMHGYSAEEFSRLRLFDLVAAADAAHVGRRVKRIADGEEISFEVTHRRKDETLFPLHVRARKAEWYGRPAILSVMTDLTERKRTEEALRLSERKYRNLVENALLGIGFAKDNRVVFANRALLDIFGYATLDEFAAVPLLSHVAPESRAIVQDERRILDGGGSSRFEYSILRKDGARRTLEILSQRVELEDGVYTQSTFQDITERIRANEETRKSQQVLSAFMDSASDMFYILDADLRFIEINRSALRFFGIARENIIGKSLEEIVPDVVASGSLERHREVIRTGEPFVIEDFVPHPKFGDMHFILKSFKVGDGLGVIVSDVSDRKKAEDRLAESEAKFRNIVDASPMGMHLYQLDERDRLVFLGGNPAADGILHIDHDQLVGRTIEDAFPGLIGTEIPDRYREIARAGAAWRASTFDYEDDRIRGAYDVFAFQTSPRRMAVFFLDVTDRQRAEEALRVSERQLSEALRMARAGYWEYDVATDTFTFNDHFYRIFRTTAREVGGYRMSSAEYARRFCHPDDARLVAIETRAAIEAADPGYSRRIEHRMVYADGEIGYVSVTFFLVKDEHGRTVKTYGVNQDITERKQAERSLRESEERFRLLVQNSNDIVEVVDKEGFPSYISSHITSILGYQPEELLGESSFTRIHPDDFPGIMSVFIDGLGQQGAVRKAEYRYRHKDGRWIDLEAVGCNLLHDPAVNGIVLNIRDITERKRAEEEKAVLHAQLIQSQKMESVGRLAGGVAHDFNNVLTVILGFAEFGIDDLREGDPLRENLEEIRSASERAAAITRQLLAFSRKQVLQPIALDLNAVATGLEKMLRRLLGEDIELAQVLGPDLGIVTADRVQIEQVIVNLAINARDAMPQGGKLTIETANVELDEEYAALHVSVKPGPYVLLAVSDTGHGMDEATKTRIFEPFFTTKEVGKGTGLGLSTVYGIVKQSGGNIWVYSEPGKGTTFKIYLPCDRSAVAAGSAPAARKIPIRGGETILIVEDEEALRGLAERSLKRAGFHVLTAADGEQALLLCEKHPKPIHLLLTDVVMPRMSGRVLAERLTTVRPAMKVLFMSGYTDNAIVHHGILVPGTQFIAKPFGVVALAAKVREVLDSTPNSGAR